MKYIICIICIIVYFTSGIELGYSVQSPLYTHITYMFQHATGLHLSINLLSFTTIFISLQKINNRVTWFIASIIIAVIASFFSMYKAPTVGLSGLIYAMLGIYIIQTMADHKVRIVNVKRYILFIAMIILSLLLSFFASHSNIILHTLCFVLGAITSALYFGLKR